MLYSQQQLNSVLDLEVSIQPTSHIVPVPYELATDPRLEPGDPRTWIILASYATMESAKSSAEFDSPGFETLARLCNATVNTIRKSVRRLSGDFGHEYPRGDNWIRILPSEPGGPLRIELSIPKPEIVYTDSAARTEIGRLRVEPDGGNQMAATHQDGPSVSPAFIRPHVDTTLKFSHPLIAFAGSIRLKSPDGQWFDVPTIETLYEASGFATEPELRKGLQRFKQYMDRHMPVSTPIALWRSMFQAGRFVMNRKTIAERTIPRQTGDFSVPNSIRDDRRRAAMDLAKGLSVEIGKLHPKLRATLEEKNALIVRGGVHCELRPDMELLYNLASDSFRIDIVNRTTGEITQ